VQGQDHGIGRSLLRGLTATLAGLAALPLPALAATQGYTISSFDAVRIDAPVKVILTTGGGSSARAEGDQAVLDRLRVDLSGRLLSVTLPAPTNGAKAGGAVTLRLSTPDLRKVVLTGGGSIAVSRMKGQQVDILVGGSGDVTITAVDADRLDVSLSGSGRIALTGRAAIANLRVSGPGSIAAEPLSARQAALINEGPGSIAVTASVTATIRATGSGDVSVLGKPACTADNRGTGRISCAGEDY
jgi:hypothetical protein